MVTGASTADCAVILVDARKGVLTQTRRHSYLVCAARHPPRRGGGEQDGSRRLLRGALPGDRGRVPRVRARSSASRRSRSSPCRRCAATTSSTRPTRCRGTAGRRSCSTWRRSRSTRSACRTRPSGMPVQWVNRPSSDFRGFTGTIAGGSVAPGDRVVVLPRGQETTVAAHRHLRRRPRARRSRARR